MKYELRCHSVSHPTPLLLGRSRVHCLRAADGIESHYMYTNERAQKCYNKGKKMNLTVYDAKLGYRPEHIQCRHHSYYRNLKLLHTNFIICIGQFHLNYFASV